MQCPHCTIAFRDIWHHDRMKYDNRADSDWECITTVCPECHKPSIKMAKIPSPIDGALIDSVRKAFVKPQWVYPSSRRRKHIGDEVPDYFKSDYFEAGEVLLVSPRSSATLSRRILEALLREQGYDSNSLYGQINAVRNEADPDKKLPSVLLTFIDAVRRFGNFSAHQKTNLETFQIIEVEPGEAELCLEIVEGLFEHYYVRPAIDAKNLKTVNERMQQLGRDPL